MNYLIMKYFGFLDRLPLCGSLKKDNDTKNEGLKKIVYYTALILSGLGIPLFAFGIINTMVSIKYETNYPTDCISGITGKDLCLTLNVFRGLTLGCVIVIISLIMFKKRILDE